MKTKLEVIKEVLPEVERLVKKLKEAEKELKDDPDMYMTTKYSAARRSALDVKKELTKLIQDTNYRYGR